jgi:hypothetical protein
MKHLRENRLRLLQWLNAVPFFVVHEADLAPDSDASRFTFDASRETAYLVIAHPESR